MGVSNSEEIFIKFLQKGIAFNILLPRMDNHEEHGATTKLAGLSEHCQNQETDDVPLPLVMSDSNRSLYKVQVSDVL